MEFVFLFFKKVVNCCYITKIKKKGTDTMLRRYELTDQE